MRRGEYDALVRGLWQAALILYLAALSVAVCGWLAFALSYRQAGWCSASLAWLITSIVVCLAVIMSLACPPACGFEEPSGGKALSCVLRAAHGRDPPRRIDIVLAREDLVQHTLPVCLTLAAAFLVLAWQPLPAHHDGVAIALFVAVMAGVGAHLALQCRLRSSWDNADGWCQEPVRLALTRLVLRIARAYEASSERCASDRLLAVPARDAVLEYARREWKWDERKVAYEASSAGSLDSLLAMMECSRVFVQAVDALCVDAGLPPIQLSGSWCV